MSQMIENSHPPYHEYPYGIWLPKDNPELIEKIKKYIQIRGETSGYTMMYFNGYRVRTPRDPGSHPCYNCGHCIDKGIWTCRNKKCIRDRKKRGLCPGYNGFEYGSSKNWIHKIEKKFIQKRNKRGVNFSIGWCEVCHKEIKWLDDYPQEQHIEDYISMRVSLGEIQIKSLDVINNKIYLENQKKKMLGSFSIIKNKKTFTLNRTASGELKHLVLIRDNYRCVECGATNKESKLEIDHKIPWSKGGKTELNNLQVLCKECNRAKHTRIWEGGK